MTRPLAGMAVVVTRPARQAARLSRLLADDGAEVIAFPTLVIEPVSPDTPAGAAPVLDAYDWAIYTSANAVEHSLTQIGRPAGRDAAPAAADGTAAAASVMAQPRPRVAAIGRATARALAESGVHVDVLPAAGADSEGLLALPEFANPQGLRILIVKGVGGRDALRAGLAQRGAEVATVEVYRRSRATPSPVALEALDKAGTSGTVVVAATSAEVLESLLALAPELRYTWLRDAPLVLPAARVAAQARHLGWRGPLVIAASAEDTAMAEALREWVRSAGLGRGTKGPA